MSEFKEFAMKGNVVDMAVGVVIGGAFGKIVSSLVADIIMPVVGVVTGGMDFSSMNFVLKPETTDAAGEVVAAVTLNYGVFIQNTVDFLIVAFAIFSVIKAMNSMKKTEEAAPEPEAPAEPPAEEKLLSEIRDLLKAKA